MGGSARSARVQDMPTPLWGWGKGASAGMQHWGCWYLRCWGGGTALLQETRARCCLGL